MRPTNQALIGTPPRLLCYTLAVLFSSSSYKGRLRFLSWSVAKDSQVFSFLMRFSLELSPCAPFFGEAPTHFSSQPRTAHHLISPRAFGTFATHS